MRDFDLIGLGYSVAVHGIDAHRGEVSRLVATARAHNVLPAASAVLGDPRAPEVARLRALARVADALRRRRSESSPPARVA